MQTVYVNLVFQHIDRVAVLLLPEDVVLLLLEHQVSQIGSFFDFFVKLFLGVFILGLIINSAFVVD